jgi:Replication initiator protein A
MEPSTIPDTPQSRELYVGKLYIENTLLRVAGALFCHDPKGAATHKNQIALSRGPIEKHLVIRPDAELGQPGPLAHRIFVALIKKHSDYGRPVPNEVSFKKRELMRLAGRKKWGGADSEQLSRALTQIQTTLVSASFKDHDGRYIEEKFHVFSKTRIERREFASDPIESCTITLADPIIASLQDEHFTCLNHALMIRLGTIAQALYMRLFFHFANLHDGHNEKRLSFSKRYDDICTEWLGGLKIVKQKSKIIDRLGRHLDQLVDERFLASYRVEAAKGREGFVISFRPAALFFEDYHRFYVNQSKSDPQRSARVDRQEIGDPLKVAYLFIEKRSGRPANTIDFVPTKDVETAKVLLSVLNFGEVSAFLDYALAEASHTSFDVRTLGGLKQYLPGYLAHKERVAAHRAGEAAQRVKEQEQAERSTYDSDRRREARKLLASLPDGEQAIIEAKAHQRAEGFTGSIRDTMLDFARVRLTIERHGSGLQTFEEWKAQHA